MKLKFILAIAKMSDDQQLRGHIDFDLSSSFYTSNHQIKKLTYKLLQHYNYWYML